jgi:hypothetical protein
MNKDKGLPNAPVACTVERATKGLPGDAVALNQRRENENARADRIATAEAWLVKRKWKAWC